MHGIKHAPINSLWCGTRKHLSHGGQTKVGNVVPVLTFLLQTLQRY